MNLHLQAEHITFYYQPHHIIFQDVSVSIPHASLTAIVGPNGAGKSTLLRILAGLAKPQAGHVRLNGLPIHAYPSRERAKQIGFLPQLIYPLFALTVREIVALGRYPHRKFLHTFSNKDLETIENAMKIMNMSSFRDRYLNELSGGEQKRAYIASILAQEPQILLLDEPLAGLDLPSQIETLQHLKQLSNMGYTVCISSHDLNRIARFVSHIILLSAEHELIAEGPPQSVLTAENLHRAYQADFWVGTHPYTESILIEVIPKTTI